MAKKLHTKKLLRSLAWLALGIALIVVLIAAINTTSNAVCKNIVVTIVGNDDNKFITSKGILLSINANEIINKKTIQEIDVDALEQKLTQNVWVENVNVYFTKNQILQIEVQQRVPYYRIFAKNGNSFYLDKNNVVLPLSDDYSAKLPLFTNFSNNKKWSFADSATLASTNVMATYLNNNPFWMAQIQQIDIKANDVFELTPTVGNHLIIFGDTTNMDSKFKKLEKFYKKVSTIVGFDKYAVLDVQFKNQIVASNNYVTNIDSVTAESTIQAFLRGTADSSFVTVDTTVKRTTQLRDTVAPVINRTVTTNRTTAVNRTTATSRTTPTTTARGGTAVTPTTTTRSGRQQQPTNNTNNRRPNIVRPGVAPPSRSQTQNNRNKK
jgi:cell division protein FtsQ